jgi:predicted ribosome quality control (RQC) complex YloA/Tae2 family protein
MIIHYYTLYHVVKELQSLIGCRLEECFSQERNSLVFKFSDGINDYYLLYFGSQPNTSLFLKKDYSRARKNTVDLFDSVVGEVLQNVFLHENNRIIQLDLLNTKIFIYLFGGSNSNLFAVNHGGIIIESLKARKEYIGSELDLPKPNMPEIAQFAKDSKIIDALSKCSYNLGRYYAEEILYRVEITADSILQELSEEKMDLILSTAERVRAECFETSEYYHYETEDGLLLSLIPLMKYSNWKEKFSNVSDAIARRVFSDIRKQSYNSLYKELFGKLRREKSRLEKNIEMLRDEASIVERADKYRLFGELLLSYPNPKNKSIKEIILKDYEGKEIEIPLDDKKNILENANKYFEKSRKAKEEYKIRKKRLPDLELKLIRIENAMKLLNEAETYRELEITGKKLKEITGNKTMDIQENTATKFREFNLGEGYIVYVGRNASNNDELTMKFAKPNDYWFHARGSGGSHVVLRIIKDEKPPKEIMKKTASIAAYYSQARNAKYVPVAYTQKKYVRKPKGANTGSVVMTKEEVVMVEPKLPEDLEK